MTVIELITKVSHPLPNRAFSDMKVRIFYK